MRTLWTLAPVSAICGIFAAIVFRKFSDRDAIRSSVNRIVAHILEFRLFLDSPRLIFRAQRELVGENFTLLRLIAIPCAILAAPFALAMVQLNSWYDRAPLPVGEDAIVTVQLKTPAVVPMQIEAPPGVSVETPAVRIVHDRQITWLIRPLRDFSGALRFVPGNHAASIVAGEEWSRLAPRQALRDPAIAWVEISYPESGIFGLNWLIWFIVISSISAAIATMGFGP